MLDEAHSAEPRSVQAGNSAEPAIQRYCGLLAGTLGDPRIQAVSANLAAFLACEPTELLGLPLQQCIGLAQMHDGTATGNLRLQHMARLPESGNQPALDASILRGAGIWAVQLEAREHWRPPSTGQELQALDGIETAADVDTLMDELCRQARGLLGCERVCVARFHEDGHGEVIAENRDDRCNTMLGLHFSEAALTAPRRLRLANEGVRLVVDASAGEAGILRKDSAIELVQSLEAFPGRAASPECRGWLESRGIRSFLGAAITQEGRLWGLLVAHGAQAMDAGPTRRNVLANRVLAATYRLEALLRRGRARQRALRTILARQLADLPSEPRQAAARIGEWCEAAGSALGLQLAWSAPGEPHALAEKATLSMRCGGRGVLDVVLNDARPRRWEHAPGAVANALGLFADGQQVGWSEPLEAMPRRQLPEDLQVFLREAATAIGDPSQPWSLPEANTDIKVNPERTAALLEAIPDLVVLMDGEGHYIASHGNEALLAAPPAHIIGKRMDELLPPQIVADANAAINRLADTGRMQKIEYRLAIGSELREFEARLAACGSGEVLTIVRDITHAKRLGREQAMMASIVRHTDSAALLTAADGTIRWCNPAFERFTGYTLGEMLGKRPGELLQGPGTDPKTVAYMGECLAKGEGFDCTVLNYTRLEEPYWIELRVRPIHDDEGRLDGFISVQNDVTARVLAEQRLKRERDVFASGPVVAVVWPRTPGGAMRFVSENIEYLLGYTALALTEGRIHVGELIHPEDHPRVIEELDLGLAGNAPRLQQSYRLRHTDGSYRWIEDHTVIERDDQGRVISRRGYLIDRSRERRIADALQIGEAKLRSLFEGSAVAMVLIDLETERVIEANPACARLTGISGDKLAGQCLGELVGPGEQHHHVEQTRRLATGEWLQPYERTILRPDGSQFRALVSGTPYSGENGRRLAWVLVQDISIQIAQRDRERQNLVELQRANALLENAGRLARLGHFEIRGSNAPLLMSPMARAIYEVNEPDCASIEDSLRFYAPEYRQRLRFLWRRCMERGEPWQVECEVLTGIGRRIWVQIRAEAVLDERGAIRGMQGVVQDIDERRRIENLLAERNWLLEETTREARALAESRSRFLANTSHEVRSPLTAVLAYSERALRQEMDVDALRQSMQAVHSSARHLLDVVNDLLDSAQIDAGQMSVDCSAQALLRLVEETVTLVKPAAEAKGLEVRIEDRIGSQAWVFVDPMRLRQVLFNLLGNAIKFSDSGMIEIRVQQQKGTDGFVVDVVDQGIGISPAQLAQLFQPFTPGDASLARRHGGTGLGLHISRELMRLMGGELSCTETGPGGSIFSLSVRPCAPHTVDTPAPAASPSSPHYPRLHGRVLLADDDPLLRDILSNMLVDLGLEVELACDGVQAVERASSERFDLLLLDMHMPRLDGASALRRLHELGWQGTALALTADVVPESVKRYIEAGCVEVLSKPIGIDALASALARWLGKDLRQEPAAPPAAADPATGPALPRGIDRVRTMFCSGLPSEIDALEQERQAGDLDALVERVHRLKGSSGFLGYARLHAALAAAESALKSIDANGHDASGSLLETALAELRMLLDANAGDSDG